MNRLYLAAWLALTAGIPFLPAPASAGTYIFAGETNGIDVVTHPTGYTGTGGVVSVGVCIDPASSNAAAMEISVQNIVETFNQLQPTTPNLIFGGSNNIPATDVDFESVALHEVGHCIGLGHVNLATESGLSGADQNYTKSTDGPPPHVVAHEFDINDGADNVRGSSDDLRGDDVNLHYFRTSNNNPFTIAGTVDGSTYSRSLADLPSGTFAANADRTVATLLGFPNTEAVMQQGSFFDEDQRALNHDDVATLRYGMSGLNETAGNGDDYTIQLTYDGLTAACEVVLKFDNAETGFAVCQTGGFFISATDHVQITSADIFFNTGFSWFFNDQLSTACSVGDIDLVLPDPGSPVNGTVVVEACNSITAGPYIVGSSGTVTFTAPSIILESGFNVQSGGTFTADGSVP